ncbi:reverse transcriptase domain-containing protein [Tanacetum coccineum]
MDEFLALADLGASINLMPLSVWKNLSLSELTPTCMTFKLADRSISRPIGIVEDVYVKVGKFQFPADFVVVDFEPDPRVLLILENVRKEVVIFNLDQTSRYSSNYDDNLVNRIDVIDMACEEYSQEVLGFSDVITSGNPTPYYDPIISSSSPTLTPFEDSDFLLEEVDAFLALEDDPTSPKVDHSYYDSEGDILLLEAFLNDDPLLPPPSQGMYLPQIRKELKICEAKNDKSSIDEPHEKKHGYRRGTIDKTLFIKKDKKDIILVLSPNLSMAQLKYCDKHNQVGFLFKPAESAGYTKIVDFLRRSKLRYALTHNPPIYDSLVKQFWQTAPARTLADGTQQLNATIDNTHITQLIYFGRLRCKGVTKQIIGVVPKGLALRVVLVDIHSKDESGKGFKLEVN